MTDERAWPPAVSRAARRLARGLGALALALVLVWVPRPRHGRPASPRTSRPACPSRRRTRRSTSLRAPRMSSPVPARPQRSRPTRRRSRRSWPSTRWPTSTTRSRSRRAVGSRSRSGRGSTTAGRSTMGPHPSCPRVRPRVAPWRRADRDPSGPRPRPRPRPGRSLPLPVTPRPVDGGAPGTATPAMATSATVGAPVTRATPAATDLRRQVFGFLPYWELNDASTRLTYDLLSTIAYFGVGADAQGNLIKRNRDGSRSIGWAGWTSSRLTSVIQAAHRKGTRVVLTVQAFAWTTEPGDEPGGPARQPGRPADPRPPDRRGRPGSWRRRREPRLRAARVGPRRTSSWPSSGRSGPSSRRSRAATS